MMGNEFYEEFKAFDVPKWEVEPQNIQLSQVPFVLHVTVDNEPAYVNLTKAYGSSGPLFLRLGSSSTVRFREDGIQIDGESLQESLVFDATVQPGARITVGPVRSAPGMSKTCSHSIAPPRACPLWSQLGPH